MHEKIRDPLERAERFLEDLIIVVLSIILIVLALSALMILSTDVPTSVENSADRLALLSQMGFLAKAEYFAALMLPWVAMIVGLLVVREVWLIRRRMEMMQFSMFRNNIVGKRTTRRTSRRTPRRRRR